MIRLAALLAVLALPAAAQDSIDAPGILSNDDFFRAVACAAPPGGDCQKPILRWRADRPIRVALRQVDSAFLGRPRLRAAAALERALQELNGADAGFRLAAAAAGTNAEIELFFLDLPSGATIAGTGVAGVDGARLGEVSTRVLFNRDTGFIERAAIVFSTSLETRSYESAMLEELTRAMGLITNVKGEAYDQSSILAQGANARTTLGVQDIIALRQLYATTHHATGAAP